MPDNRINRVYVLQNSVTAHPYGDGETEETSLEKGERVVVFGIATGPMPSDTTVHFKRANGELWSAGFDSGDPFNAIEGPFLVEFREDSLARIRELLRAGEDAERASRALTRAQARYETVNEACTLEERAEAAKIELERARADARFGRKD